MTQTQDIIETPELCIRYFSHVGDKADIEHLIGVLVRAEVPMENTEFSILKGTDGKPYKYRYDVAFDNLNEEDWEDYLSLLDEISPMLRERGISLFQYILDANDLDEQDIEGLVQLVDDTRVMIYIPEGMQVKQALASIGISNTSPEQRYVTIDDALDDIREVVPKAMASVINLFIADIGTSYRLEHKGRVTLH